jgi:hypothetical protein
MKTGRNMNLTHADYPDVLAAAKEVLRDNPGLTAAEINEEFKTRGWGDIEALDIIEGLLEADPDVRTGTVYYVD